MTQGWRHQEVMGTGNGTYWIMSCKWETERTGCPSRWSSSQKKIRSTGDQIASSWTHVLEGDRNKRSQGQLYSQIWIKYNCLKQLFWFLSRLLGNCVTLCCSQRHDEQIEYLLMLNRCQHWQIMFYSCTLTYIALHKLISLRPSTIWHIRTTHYDVFYLTFIWYTKTGRTSLQK